MKRFCLLAILSLLSVAPAQADDASTNASLEMQFGTHAGFREVFDSLKDAAANGDAKALAKVIIYPLRVNTGGRKQTIKSPKVFIAKYATIMTPSIVKAIESATYSELMVNAQGAMIGNGEVWISSKCADNACSRSKVGVITIQEVQP